MKERVVQFGDCELVGTVTVPDEADAPAKPLGFLFLNAGFVHRVGPHRMNVRAARRFARHGYTGMRFDFSGLGDSKRAPGSESQRDRALREVRAAMTATTGATGIDRFILVGLCAGTDPCIYAAMEDPRVAGVVLIDPFAFRTLRTRINYNLRRIREEATPVKLLQALVRKLTLLAKKAVPSGPDAASFIVRELPPREEYENWYRTMLDRGVQVFVMYTGGFPEWYNYASQFSDRHGNFGNSPLLRIEYRPEANHTFTELQIQERLLEDILTWATGIAGAKREAA